MGFSKPKTPRPTTGNDASIAAINRAAEDARRDLSYQLPQPDAFRVAPMAQNTAQDQAAAERMARQNMARKKGLQYSMNPQGLL